MKMLKLLDKPVTLADTAYQRTLQAHGLFVRVPQPIQLSSQTLQANSADLLTHFVVGFPAQAIYTNAKPTDMLLINQNIELLDPPDRVADVVPEAALAYTFRIEHTFTKVGKLAVHFGDRTAVFAIAFSGFLYRFSDLFQRTTTAGFAWHGHGAGQTRGRARTAVRGGGGGGRNGRRRGRKGSASVRMGEQVSPFGKLFRKGVEVGKRFGHLGGFGAGVRHRSGRLGESCRGLRHEERSQHDAGYRPWDQASCFPGLRTSGTPQYRSP